MTRTAFLSALAPAAAPCAFLAAGTGSALAPEPARLDANLPASAGAAAAATFVDTNVPTRARYYTGSWITDLTVAAGTPCSSTGIASGTKTARVIQRSGAYARCW